MHSEIKVLLTAIVLLLLHLGVEAKVYLPSPVASSMVLQRDTVVNIWGKAEPGRRVKIRTSWNGKSCSVRAGADSVWLAKVPTGAAGGPYEIVISDGEPLVLDNVMLGEVWICSGQSNMEMPMCGFTGQEVEGGREEIMRAPLNRQIHLFRVPMRASGQPEYDCPGSWKEASPASVSEFSAVGWFFARYVSEMLGGIPVGVISAVWGGSRIESWMEGGKNYNGMLYPLHNYTAKGFLWYQGCAQADNAPDYCRLMAEMAGKWREDWQSPGMPLYFAQLAPFRYQSREDNWYGLMVEQQALAAKRIPHCAMAATTDLGEEDNIHFARKREVGERLAMLALSRDYGVEGLPSEAPVYNHHENLPDGTVRLWMDNLSESWWGPDNLRLGSFPGFELAGEDRIFYPAEAHNRGHWKYSNIDISCPEVPEPVAVRYAFRNWSGANVSTTLGQPLVPFRTDGWPVPEIGYGYDLPVVIMDTDAGNDIDDVLALQMLLNAEKQGKLVLRAVTSSKSNRTSAVFLDAYCRSQGRPGIPVGEVTGGANPGNGNYLLPTLDVLEDVGQKEYPESWKLLRKILSLSKNASVDLIVTGPLTNMARLLESAPDSLSSLDGAGLVAKKVKSVRIMGGSYTESEKPEWNIAQDISAAKTFFEKCPVAVIAGGFEIGSSFRYPYSTLERDFAPGHPLRVAYDHFLVPPYDRPSWDMTVVLDLLEPSLFARSEACSVEVASDGRTLSKACEDGKVRWLLKPEANIMDKMTEYIK